jgi:hypothetical protein
MSSGSGSYFQKVPVSDPTFFRPFFKGPKMAFQNIIFKEYLNSVYKNGQNDEITPFLWFLLMFTSIFGYGPGSGSETLELRIRIRQKFRILADPDPQHWRKLADLFAYLHLTAQVIKIWFLDEEYYHYHT